MASFPLKCIICSKSHDYSDISHLLTHIASKSHLSNYFHAQVRSHQDAGVLQKLRVYDEWYSKNNMEKLLSQRMLQKEARKSTSQRQPRTTRADRKPKIKRENNLDPSLFDQSYDLEVPSTPIGSTNQLLASQGQVEKQYATPTASQFNGPYPLVDRERSSTTAISLPVCDGNRIPQRTAYIDDLKVGDSDIEEENDTLERSDMTRLKGIIWPGMDLFDAASPEARRMRNQKKDSAVLATMQANSELVEPTEVIYHPSWEVKKERFISGEVESSPPPFEVPKRKRKSEKSPSLRQPLMELDPNLFSNMQQNRRFWDTSGGLQKHKIRATSHLLGTSGGLQQQSNKTQLSNKTESTDYGTFGTVHSFHQTYGTYHGLPSPWDSGYELRYGDNRPLDDGMAEKENIPPILASQDGSSYGGMIATQHPLFAQPAGKSARPQIQHQVPPTVDFAAMHTFHGSSISAPLISNLPRHQAAGQCIQDMRSFQNPLQRPRDGWAKRSQFPEAFGGPALHENSSGDETIDQEIDDGSF